MIVGQSHYLAGKKYCRRCECYLVTNKIFCPCCGMQLRTTPIESAYKQELRDEKRKISYNFRPKNNMVKATSLIDIKVTPIINRKK
jgi:uncharacterized Zn finger protein (UPF0148 family)